MHAVISVSDIFSHDIFKKNKFSPHTCEDNAAAARPSAEAKKTGKQWMKPQISLTGEMMKSSETAVESWNRSFKMTAVNLKGPSRGPYFRGLNR